MIQGRILAPPSPPSSPRMSGQDYKPVIPNWHDQPEQHSNFGQGYQEGVNFQTPNDPAQGDQKFTAQSGSSLRSYRTSPYPLSAQYHSHSLAGSAYPLPPLQNAELPPTSHASSGQQSGTALGQRGFTTSVTGSPLSRSSPRSDVGEEHEEDAEDDDPDASGEVEDEEGKPPMTAAELRNQKRKMKRFRLTHNQTRFLMSEFARQAHPDAAHRERLSREIPGLSPRQVQVWFQNRRAKLKRLTAEDRDRMMRSRALPENFDMTASLHGSFGGPVSGSGTPGASPASFGTAMHPHGHIRPLTLDTLRRGEVGPSYVSPTTGIHSTMGPITFTPPQSATDTMSPISGPDMSGFGFAQRPIMDSPRGIYRPSNQPAPYSQPPRPLAGHDRFRRASGETASSPLRSSLSYDSPSAQSTQAQQQRPLVMQTTEPQNLSPQQIEAQRNMPPPGGPPPYGLGFSYLNYPPNVRPPQPPASSPQSVDMMQSYQRDGQQLLGQHPHGFSEFQGFHSQPPYSSPQVPQYGHFAGQYGQTPTTYASSYMQRSDQQPQPHSNMPGQLPRPHFGGGNAGGNDNDGAATTTTSY